MDNERKQNPMMSGDDPIDFADRIIESERFRDLFREGMQLLEETADYLDGPGRDDSKELGRLAGLAYAAESMKLTTRLMQLASWLLVQRALTEGEVTFFQATAEREKIKLNDPANAETSSGYDELPVPLLDLIERSVRLQERVRHLDDMVYGERDAPKGDSAVHTQFDRLKAAFGRPGGDR